MGRESEVKFEDLIVSRMQTFGGLGFGRNSSMGCNESFIEVGVKNIISSLPVEIEKFFINFISIIEKYGTLENPREIPFIADTDLMNSEVDVYDFILGLWINDRKNSNNQSKGRDEYIEYELTDTLFKRCFGSEIKSLVNFGYDVPKLEERIAVSIGSDKFTLFDIYLSGRDIVNNIIMKLMGSNVHGGKMCDSREYLRRLIEFYGSFSDLNTSGYIEKYADDITKKVVLTSLISLSKYDKSRVLSDLHKILILQSEEWRVDDDPDGGDVVPQFNVGYKFSLFNTVLGAYFNPESESNSIVQYRIDTAIKYTSMVFYGSKEMVDFYVEYGASTLNQIKDPILKEEIQEFVDECGKIPFHRGATYMSSLVKNLASQALMVSGYIVQNHILRRHANTRNSPDYNMPMEERRNSNDPFAVINKIFTKMKLRSEAIEMIISNNEAKANAIHHQSRKFSFINLGLTKRKFQGSGCPYIDALIDQNVERTNFNDSEEVVSTIVSNASSFRISLTKNSGIWIFDEIICATNPKNLTASKVGENSGVLPFDSPSKGGPRRIEYLREYWVGEKNRPSFNTKRMYTFEGYEAVLNEVGNIIEDLPSEDRDSFESFNSCKDGGFLSNESFNRWLKDISLL